MKIFSTLTLATIATLSFAGVAQADEVACSEGYVAVASAGGPLCVAPLYLEGRWEDPTGCTHGYYQGSCAPAPSEPVVFTPEAYAFQTIPAPAPAVVEVVVASTVADFRPVSGAY